MHMSGRKVLKMSQETRGGTVQLDETVGHIIGQRWVHEYQVKLRNS